MVKKKSLRLNDNKKIILVQAYEAGHTDMHRTYGFTEDANFLIKKGYLRKQKAKPYPYYDRYRLTAKGKIRAKKMMTDGTNLSALLPGSQRARKIGGRKYNGVGWLIRKSDKEGIRKKFVKKGYKSIRFIPASKVMRDSVGATHIIYGRKKG